MPLLEALISLDAESSAAIASRHQSIVAENSIDCLYEPAVILPTMSELEEVVSDYRTMNLSTGKHPMAFYRPWAKGNKVFSCLDLYAQEDGENVIVAGGVICRQRPETAKGFVFLTLEDETGMANIIIKPKLFDVYRQVVMQSSLLKVEGLLQLEHGVCNVIARHFEALPPLKEDLYVPARNFH
jgi:DNA polymerase III alpha subunit